MHFVDENTGWVVGNIGVVLKTTDGGSSWEAQEMPTTCSFNDVYFTSSTTGCVVGSDAWEIGIIFNTVDGGSTWSSQEADETLNDVFFLDNSTGWVAGGSGSILYSSNEGTAWTSIESGTDINLQSVFFLDQDNGWVTTTNGNIRYTTNGGTTWNGSSISPPPGSTAWYDIVVFLGGNSGWVIGEKDLASGAIAAYGGSDWSIIQDLSYAGLYGMDFYDDLTGWIVGDSGTILNTTNGISWTSQESGTTEKLLDVNFVTSTLGWAVGENGTILKYSE